MDNTLIAFDCDGVLVDSEIIAAEVDAALLTEAGYEISAADMIHRFAGMTGEMIFEAVEAQMGRPLPADIAARAAAEIDRRLSADLKAVPGALELLTGMKGARCTCSNSSPARLALSLRKAGLFHELTPYIYSAVEVGDRQPKPAPNVYLHAAGQFGLSPRRMLVIEDSRFGVAAAKAAGARVIGFTGGRHTWPGHADALMDAGAETVIRRLAEVPRVAEAIMAWEGLEE
jgi:HAD superfamily hydrolase (TIGR01509 family)